MDKPTQFSHYDHFKELGSVAPFSDKLRLLHKLLREQHPFIDRIAIALYDDKTDQLRTFAWSSDERSPLTHYQSKMCDSPSLEEIVRKARPRLVNDMDIFSEGKNLHTQVLAQCEFRSSYTFPMYQDNKFLGFIFYNSVKKDAFDELMLNELDMVSHMLALIVSHEQDMLGTLQATVRSAMSFTHYRDPETADHIDRMSRYSRLIARELASEFDFDDVFVDHIFLFSPLHDIGKISIPDSILLKPGKLTEQEYDVMKKHASKGREIIDALLQNYRLDSVSYINVLRNIAEHHHEAYDGSGYPHGLSATDIPIEARIVAVADIFDALTSRRTYKEPWSNERAFNTLKEMAGIKLDARCVEVLIENEEKILHIQKSFQENSFG